MENELLLLTIIAYNPRYVELLQIKPVFLLDETNKTLLYCFIESYRKNKLITSETCLEFLNKKEQDSCILRYTELFTNELYTQEDIYSKFIYAQEKILDTYKKKIIDKLAKELSLGEITNDIFAQRIKDIEDFRITKESSYLTKEELKQNITARDKGIIFTKFPKLNKHLCLYQNDLLIVGAGTGTGKSSFLLNLMNDFMNNYQCIYFNIEMSKTALYRRLIAIYGDIPISAIDHPTDYQKKLIDKSLNEIPQHSIIFEHQMNNIKDIRSVIAKNKDYSKHTIVFIDHIGLVKCDNKNSLYEQSTEVAKQLRAMCLEYDCTIVCASQLNRLAMSSEEITLNMLKDSGELENSSRKVILLYPVKDQDKESLEIVMNVDIAKNDSGLTGIIAMDYNKSKQIFKERLT